MARMENAASLLRGLVNKRKRQVMIDAMRAFDNAPPAECPCCGHVGPLWPYGVQFNVECQGCGAFERHRLFWLMQKRYGILKADDRVLHFAPEGVLANLAKSVTKEYHSADLSPGRAELQLNIEQIDLPDGSYDAAICSHVLEHVNDRKALAELYRILTPGGRLIILIPVIEGWDVSYEDPAITDGPQRDVHFGQDDHVRRYGRDVRDRIRAAGFELTEYTSTGAEFVKYGLQPGERVFLATKPKA